MNGYVYVIGFDNGVVKVGRSSSNPNGRLTSHKNTMKIAGAKAVSEWVSVKHGNSAENELKLIHSLSNGIVRSREWAVIDYEFVLNIAMSLEFKPKTDDAISSDNLDLILGGFNDDTALINECGLLSENIGIFVPEYAVNDDYNTIVNLSHVMMVFYKKTINLTPTQFQADVISAYLFGGYDNMRDYIFANFYSDKELIAFVKAELCASKVTEIFISEGLI
jgi:hypothetical protein